MRLAALVSVVVVPLSIGGCSLFSPQGALCARLDECRQEENLEDDNEDSDEGRDDVAVCTETNEGAMRALRANTEPECGALANAIDNHSRCRAGLECDELLGDEGDACEAEQDQIDDACKILIDDEIDCESFLVLACLGVAGEE